MSSRMYWRKASQIVHFYKYTENKIITVIIIVELLSYLSDYRILAKFILSINTVWALCWVLCFILVSKLKYLTKQHNIEGSDNICKNF